MFLTPAEMRELTDRTYARYQIAWLTENSWKFEIGAAGNPKVSRSYAEQRMVGGLKPKRRGPRLEGLARA